MKYHNNKSVRVSVIMPVRNAVRTFPAAVQSIQSQTLKDWELIVVDDGSRDGTAELLGNAARADSRIHVLSPRQQGLVASLQAGIGEAHGQFIARMDADDVSRPERLARQVDYLCAHPDIGLVSCLIEFGGDRTASEGYALHVEWLNSLPAPEDIALNRFVESPLAHPSVMFRRELLAQHGGYQSGDFPEDYDLWLRWLDAGVRMAKVPQELFVWNDPPDRLSRRDPRYSPEAFYRLKACHLARAVERVRNGRAVWIWGAGRPTRARAELLTQHGIVIAGYIDIDPRKTGRTITSRPVVDPSEIPLAKSAVVLGYVANRGARELIRSHLAQRGYVEGKDCWMAA